jgi:hypothetical protein
MSVRMTVASARLPNARAMEALPSEHAGLREWCGPRAQGYRPSCKSLYPRSATKDRQIHPLRLAGTLSRAADDVEAGESGYSFSCFPSI